MEVQLMNWKTEFYMDFYRQSNDKALYANMADSFPKTLEECRAAAAYFSSDNHNHCVKAIAVNNKVIGSIGAFFDSDIYCRNAELAYWIGKDYQGMGVGSKALKVFIQYLFENYPVTRLYARPFAVNTASQKILEKSGFCCEGVLRKSVYKNNETHDALLYALIRK